MVHSYPLNPKVDGGFLPHQYSEPLLTDRKLSTLSGVQPTDHSPQVIGIHHYYPFGMQQPGRTFNAGDYRYGFNGKEKDQDGEFGDTHYNFGARIYNPAIGRFLSVDPINAKLPAYSPYNFAANRPIDGIDFGGLSWIPVVDKRGNVTGFRWTDAAPDPANNIFALALHVRDLGTYNSESDFNIGSAIITAYGENQDDIFTFDGTSLPSSLQDYATIEDGLHTAELGFHKQTSPNRYLAIRINNNGRSPVKNDYNPSNGLDYAVGINLHKAGLDNKTGLTTTGKPISAGCILCDIETFDDLINVFDNTSVRQGERQSIISARIFIWQSNGRLGLPAFLNTSINPATFTNENNQLITSPLSNPTIGIGINRSLDFPLPNIGPDAFSPYIYPTRPNATEEGNE